MDAQLALDLIWDLRRILKSVHSRRCPDCGGPVFLSRSPEGTAAWHCESCSRKARYFGEWHGGHGWLTRQGEYWVVVDSGDPERQQAQLDAYQVAKEYCRKHPADARAATLYRMVQQVRLTARYLNHAVALRFAEFHARELEADAKSKSEASSAPA